LHQSRVGPRNFGSAWTVFAPALEGVSASAVTGEIRGRASRSRCEETRLASATVADGDHLPGLSRAQRVFALRLLRRLRLRDESQVEHACDGYPGSREDRALRDSPEQLRPQD